MSDANKELVMLILLLILVMLMGSLFGQEEVGTIVPLFVIEPTGINESVGVYIKPHLIVARLYPNAKELKFFAWSMRRRLIYLSESKTRRVMYLWDRGYYAFTLWRKLEIKSEREETSLLEHDHQASRSSTLH